MEWRRSARIFSSHDKRTKQLAEMIVCYSESGSGKGGPASRRVHPFRLDALCRSRATPYAETRYPVSSDGETFPTGPTIPRVPGSTTQSGYIRKPSVSYPQTNGRHLEDTALLPPAKNRIPIHNGSGCGITSGIKRHFRLMNGTRKSILYAIGCFAGFYIL